MAKVTMTIGALAVLIAAGCNSGSPTAPGQIQITPETVTVESGQSVQLAVTDQAGARLTEGVTWRSSNVVAAQVDGNGLVTGRYANGTATITANVRSMTANATVSTVPRICIAIAPLRGAPNSDEEIQSFTVEFDPGVNAAKRTAELETQFGFRASEVTRTGFSADLTPDQAAGIQCSRDVESMAYA